MNRYVGLAVLGVVVGLIMWGVLGFIDGRTARTLYPLVGGIVTGIAFPLFIFVVTEFAGE